MVKYYTLEEAAKLLGISPDRLREMANKKEIRAFQDRGTLRFRAEDIQERARSQGRSSDPELPIGESAPKPGGPASPSPAKRKTSAEPLRTEDDEEVVLFDVDPAKGTGPASGRVLGGRSSSRLTPPRGNEDSDVRLALDGTDFPAEEDSKSRSGPKSPPRKSKVTKPDSDVKVEPPPDAEVPIGGKKQRGLSDSDIRLELEELPSMSGRSKSKHELHVTEEIDLDEEDAKPAPPPPPAKGKSRSKLSSSSATPVLPTSSPFELSEPEVNLDAPTSDSKTKKLESDSSDFELIAFDSTKSPKQQAGVPLDDESVSLGELSGGKGKSGINLGEVADSGISLEGEGSDELEFELPLDSEPPATGNVPMEDSSSDFELSIQDPAEGSSTASESDFELTLDNPAGATPGKEEDSEFELSLDDVPEDQDPSDSEFELSVSERGATEEGSDSEFELTLDAESNAAELPHEPEASSDSEFELTLDASGDLAPVTDAEEKDIFEPTNFDVPALEDESSSEAVALEDSDTDVEDSSGDFDLSVDQEDLESGSEVVTLEEGEEADEGAATVARPRAKKSKSALVELPEEVGEEEESARRSRRRAAEPEEEEEEVAVAAGEAVAQPWGPLPAILLFPTVLVLFFVGVMGFELVQGMWGYHRPMKLTKPVIDTVARMFDENLPRD
jgi:excisionase family DNA binding protein